MSMSGSSPNPLIPTFEGHIASTVDALILFEACLSGQLNHVPRRPHDRERPDLIRSGNVFIYEEHASGIKRWTDGVSWSPSRILGNFLIYRELDKPFPPGEKKRALKKGRKNQVPNGTRTEPAVRQASNSEGLTDPNDTTSNAERALIGSLVDSYPFKQDGLVKKTISITYQGVPHHLVSYYSIADVTAGRLSCPSKHPSLSHVLPRSELVTKQSFRLMPAEDDNEDGRMTAILAAHGQHQLMARTPTYAPASQYVLASYPQAVGYNYAPSPHMMPDHQHLSQHHAQNHQTHHQTQHQPHHQTHHGAQTYASYTMPSEASYTTSANTYAAAPADYTVPQAEFGAQQNNYMFGWYS